MHCGGDAAKWSARARPKPTFLREGLMSDVRDVEL
jgi:hypothetical protein